MKSGHVSRRAFLQTSLLASAGTMVPGFLYGEEPMEKNLEPIRMGAIGVGAQGAYNAQEFNKQADLVAVSDLDPDYIVGKLLDDKKLGVKKGDDVIIPEFYSDYRHLLARNDIDAVMIATPDHWHTKIAIEALQSGKHVYCQKPLTLTLEENVLIKKAAEKYGKIFQVGTQRRTQKHMMLAALIVRGGFLGEIQRVQCVLNEGRESGPLQKFSVPGRLDWNTWVGQASMRDYIASSAEPGEFWKKWSGLSLPDQSNGHLTFRWWHDFAGGKFTDWGAHYIDIALWALNRQTPGTGPVEIDGTEATFLVPYENGRPTVDNVYNTAITFDVKCRFEKCDAGNAFEMTVASTAPEKDGILFEGTKGRIHVNCDRIKGKLIEEGIENQFTDEDYRNLFNGKPVEDHFSHFIRCIREGGTPISDVPSHIQAMNICHLCGISTRLKRPVVWNDAECQITGDDQAASFFSYAQRKGFELPDV